MAPRADFVHGVLLPDGWRRPAATNVLSKPHETPKEHSMLKVLASLQNFLAEPLRRDDRGATAVEYGLILVFIAVVIIAGLTLLGANLLSLFQKVAAQI
jgi:pilus assembly protein Flp/PilA